MDEEGEAFVIRKPWTATKQLRKVVVVLIDGLEE
jgi:hypothetical protein